MRCRTKTTKKTLSCPLIFFSRSPLPLYFYSYIFLLILFCSLGRHSNSNSATTPLLTKNKGRRVETETLPLRQCFLRYRLPVSWVGTCFSCFHCTVPAIVVHLFGYIFSWNILFWNILFWIYVLGHYFLKEHFTRGPAPIWLDHANIKLTLLSSHLVYCQPISTSASLIFDLPFLVMSYFVERCAQATTGPRCLRLFKPIEPMD